MLRTTKVILVLVVALWGFTGAFGNLNDWNGTLAAVSATTSMTTFDAVPASWRATSSPVIVWLGALFILLSKVTGAVFCTIGALRMWGARASDTLQFQAAKQAALVGCAIMVIMLFGGFIVIAETWFELWRSDPLREAALGSAFRYAGLILLIALLVTGKDE
jgi:predicted small integral membrane protein